LSNRTQLENISGFISEIVHTCITSGVPQDSFLGPTLFYLFINDNKDILFDTYVCMKLFADDVKLYSSFTHSLYDLQIVCDRLATLAEKWQVRIAFDKCNIQRISYRDGVNITDCSPKYTKLVPMSYTGQMRLVTLELSLIKS